MRNLGRLCRWRSAGCHEYYVTRNVIDLFFSDPSPSGDDNKNIQIGLSYQRRLTGDDEEWHRRKNLSFCSMSPSFIIEKLRRTRKATIKKLI